MVAAEFFIQLVLILLSARILGEIVAKFNVPAVIGEMTAGILIGPSFLGWVAPTETIKLLAEIGVVLLLFEVGLESDLTRLMKAGLKATTTAVVGVLAPLALGFAISRYGFSLDLLPSLFIGSTLTATSIGITLRIFSDLKKQDSPETQIVLGAAVIDDIIGIIVLAMLFEFSESGAVSFFNAGKVCLFIAVFMLIAPILAKLCSLCLQKLNEVSDIPGALPTGIVSLILLFSYLAGFFGAPELLGGFAAGIALSPHFFLPLSKKFDFDETFTVHVQKEMKPIIHLFTPIFFVVIGLSMNLCLIEWSSSFFWLFTGIIFAVAVIGKLASGFVLFGDTRFTRLIVGVAMIPRGEVGLIFADVGQVKKVLDNELYTGLVFVIALTTLLTPFVMRWLYMKEQNKDSMPDSKGK